MQYLQPNKTHKSTESSDFPRILHVTWDTYKSFASFFLWSLRRPFFPRNDTFIRRSYVMWGMFVGFLRRRSWCRNCRFNDSFFSTVLRYNDPERDPGQLLSRSSSGKVARYVGVLCGILKSCLSDVVFRLFAFVFWLFISVCGIFASGGSRKNCESAVWVGFVWCGTGFVGVRNVIKINSENTRMHFDRLKKWISTSLILNFSYIFFFDKSMTRIQDESYWKYNEYKRPLYT